MGCPVDGPVYVLNYEGISALAIPNISYLGRSRAAGSEIHRSLSMEAPITTQTSNFIFHLHELAADLKQTVSQLFSYLSEEVIG